MSRVFLLDIIFYRHTIFIKNGRDVVATICVFKNYHFVLTILSLGLLGEVRLTSLLEISIG